MLVGNEEDLQKALGVNGPEASASSKLDPGRVLRDHRAGREAVPAHQSRGDDAARGALDQPAHLGRRGVGQRRASCGAHLRARRLRPRRRRRRLRLGAVYGLLDGRNARSRPCGSAGRMGRSSRPIRAIRRWPRSRKCGRSPRAGRREFKRVSHRPVREAAEEVPPCDALRVSRWLADVRRLLARRSDRPPSRLSNSDLCVTTPGPATFGDDLAFLRAHTEVITLIERRWRARRSPSRPATKAA